MGNRKLSRLSQAAIGSNRWIRKILCNRLISWVLISAKFHLCRIYLKEACVEHWHHDQCKNRCKCKAEHDRYRHCDKKPVG